MSRQNDRAAARRTGHEEPLISTPKRRVGPLIAGVVVTLLLLSVCVTDLPVFARPEPPSGRIELSAGWQLTSARDVKTGGVEISTTGFHADRWHQVEHMPATVLQALEDDGTYPNLYYGENLANVPNDLYQQDWWYRTTFTAPAGSSSYRIEFPGINYRAEVWLNGRQIAGSSDVVGMYTAHDLDVTPWLNQGGPNTLAVKVTPEQRLQDINGVELADSWWDWINWNRIGYQGPGKNPLRGNSFVADRNAGTFKPVYLSFSGTGVLSEPMVTTELPLPATDTARLTVYTDVRNTSSATLRGVVRATISRSGKPDITLEQPVSLGAGDGRVVYSADGKVMATVVQDYTHAPAIFAGPVASPRQITHDNDALPARTVARSVTWSNDGFTVQGWLLAPVGADPARKAPMIVNVHGGPSAASEPRYVTEGSTGDLLAAGYYVFYPNPRGSYGQGEAFTAANKRDFGGGDLRDILAGVDAAEKVAPIDDARLGLTGGSYGGFMAMWANTQTDRFKAIVAGAGLSNWISYYGTNGIDQWMIPFFGKSAYDDPEPYVKASAITYIKKAKTPTFIYVGERDIEVPPTQSVEYWHALKEMGVPTSLVIYPGEGHRLRDPANSADMRKRTVAWFDQYVKGDKQPH